MQAGNLRFFGENGKITITRRIYEDKQGNTYVPLDTFMRMEGEYTELQVVIVTSHVVV